MSTKKSSTTSSSSSSNASTKRNRKTHRKLTDREKVNRSIGHTETQLRQARESRDAARNDDERKNWEGLVTIYSNEIENLRGQLEKIDEAAGENRITKARIAAWRNAGQAMPSKTLLSDEATMLKFRDTTEAAAMALGKEYAQAFLAGWGSGVRDLSKPSKKRSKPSAESGGATQNDTGNSNGEDESNQNPESSEGDSVVEGEGEGMDTAN